MPNRLTLLTSRYLVYISIAELVAALYVVTAGLGLCHARLMFESVLPSFIAAVAVSYSSSSLRSSAGQAVSAIQGLAALASWAVAVGGIAASLFGYTESLGLSLVVLGISLAMITAFSLKRIDVRLSILTLGYTQALGGLMLLLLRGLSTFDLALAFVGVEAVGAIFAVTLHSFPSTFGDGPSFALTLTTFALLTTSALLAVRGSRLFAPLLGASMLSSLPAFRFERSRGYLAKARTSRNPVARGGMLYFLYGHLFAFASLLADGALLISTVRLQINVLILVHAVVLGVVMIFVLVHAPMMLPVIMGWPSARRYNLTPYVLQALGAVIWPLNMHVSFFLIGLALVFDALIVKPSGGPMPLSLVR
ncbi:MAG: hypothetical protein ACP5HK_06890 [Acidilobus sp.]